jgi:hypothetical protein
MEALPPRGPDGRSLGWRLGMLVGGAAIAGAGVATILWPRLLAFAVGGALALVGLVLVVSAFAARGR